MVWLKVLQNVLASIWFCLTGCMLVGIGLFLYKPYSLACSVFLFVSYALSGYLTLLWICQEGGSLD